MSVRSKRYGNYQTCGQIINGRSASHPLIHLVHIICGDHKEIQLRLAIGECGPRDIITN